MGVVSDRAQLDTTIGPDGMQKNYLVLSDEERAKGFVRPLRTRYQHVGIAGPQHQLRDLTDAERTLWGDEFAKFEELPAASAAINRATGKFWTQKQLDAVGKGCGVVTTMGMAIAETYARSPGFYGMTFCVGCRVHLPVGAGGEFTWDGTDERVGT